MATKKIKISDIAKDFDLKAKEIVDIASELGMDKKSSANTLSDDELNLLLDAIIIKHQVSDFSMYSVKKNEETVVTEKKEEPKKATSEKAEKQNKPEKKISAVKADKPEKKSAPENMPKNEVKEESEIIEVSVEKKVRYVDTRQNIIDKERLDDTKIEKIMQGTDIYGNDFSKQKIKKGPKSQKFDKQTNKLNKKE